MEGGAYTGRFNSPDGHIKASNFIELLEFLNEKVDNFPIDQFWEFIDSMTLEERKEKIKKQKKRNKKRIDKFNPENLKKPKTPMNLYRIDYKNNIIKEGKVYNQEEFNKAWSNLSDNEKQIYNDKYNTEIEKYNKDYNKALKQAIIEGEYEAPEPKKPLSIYMLFMDFCRKDNNKFVSSELKEELSNLNLIDSTLKLSELYKKFIENEDNLKLLDSTRQQYNDLYDYQYYHWKVTNLEGKIKKYKRENKNTSYLEKELEEYKNSVSFDTTTEPEINIEWIYNTSTNNINFRKENKLTDNINLNLKDLKTNTVNTVNMANATMSSKPKKKVLTK